MPTKIERCSIQCAVSSSYSELQREQEQAEAEAEAAGGVSYERPAELELGSVALSGEIQELTRLSPIVKLYMKNAQVRSDVVR